MIRMNSYLSRELTASRQAALATEAARHRLARQALATRRPAPGPQLLHHIHALRLPFRRPAQATT